MMKSDEYQLHKSGLISPEKEEIEMFHRQAYTKPKLMVMGKLQSVTLGATGTEFESPVGASEGKEYI